MTAKGDDCVRGYNKIAVVAKLERAANDLKHRLGPGLPAKPVDLRGFVYPLRQRPRIGDVINCWRFENHCGVIGVGSGMASMAFCFSAARTLTIVGRINCSMIQ